MRIASEHVLIDRGYGATVPCRIALEELRIAISRVVWPPGSSIFTIHPESGKRSGMGNGVVPIKKAFISELENLGWIPEMDFPLTTPEGSAGFGAMDAAKPFDDGLPFLVEWETGNISSSHRALNKICIGLLEGCIAGGTLVVPTQSLARYLTDRIGNLRELLPYLRLWASIDVADGYLSIIAIEHDAESPEVERIKKGTDGRALR
jgi:hypothetical protein